MNLDGLKSIISRLGLVNRPHLTVLGFVEVERASRNGESIHRGMVVCYVGYYIIWAAAGLYSRIVQLYQGLSWGILQVAWVGLHVIRPTREIPGSKGCGWG